MAAELSDWSSATSSRRDSSPYEGEAKNHTVLNAKKTRASRRAFSPCAQQITDLVRCKKEKPPGGN